MQNHKKSSNLIHEKRRWKTPCNAGFETLTRNRSQNIVSPKSSYKISPSATFLIPSYNSNLLPFFNNFVGASSAKNSIFTLLVPFFIFVAVKIQSLVHISYQLVQECSFHLLFH